MAPSLTSFSVDSGPFALLDNSRAAPGEPASMLFWGAARHIVATDGSSLERALEDFERQRRAGLFLCGYITYEAGYFLVDKKAFRLSKMTSSSLPLLSFYAFRNRELLDDEGVQRLLKPARRQTPCAIHSLELTEDEGRYAAKLAKIGDYIREGDTYQVNYTLKYKFGYQGTLLALYDELRAHQTVEYGAYLHFPEARVASLSPELFLRRDGSRLTSKPMKGTARRGGAAEEDRAIVGGMRADAKTISENVMIVDLLRNDIGRIAKPGSVRARDLFEVQTFETLHQMISTVEGEVAEEVVVGDVLRQLFPCGSITGAPKIRTMQIIEELEDEPRGIYTGAIGYVNPDGNFCFSVPIRTIVSTKESRGEMGIGSGIIVDADPADEFAECVLKGRFMTGLNEKFQLIESMRYDTDEEGPDSFSLHLTRLGRSALFFGFTWRPKYVADAVDESVRSLGPGAYKLRLLLAHDGRVSVTASPLGPEPPAPRWLWVSRCRVDSTSVFQRHKTTVRAHYDRAFQQASERGAYEVLFLNERDEVAEASRSNIFVERDGEWLTPPPESGALDGLRRRLVLADPNRRAREARLTLSDVIRADRLFVANNVRGIVEVILDPEHATEHD